MSAEAFLSDEKTLDSVIRCIQVVGEAAWKVNKPIQLAHPEVPWLQIAGMRHRLVHDYGEVDPNIAYRTATAHLPNLIHQIRVILDRYQAGA